MPINWTVDTKLRRVRITFVGRITDADLAVAQRGLAADPAFDGSFDELLDVTGVISADISHDRIVANAEQSVFQGGSRRAHVARDPVQYGLLRMFGAYANDAHGTFRLFTTRSDAEAWLDRRDDG